MAHYRITDLRSGRSLKTFSLVDEPTQEYIDALKLKLAHKKNVPLDVMELSIYIPYKKRKRTL